MARVLKKTGSFYYHCDWPPQTPLGTTVKALFGKGMRDG